MLGSIMKNLGDYFKKERLNPDRSNSFLSLIWKGRFETGSSSNEEKSFGKLLFAL
jgi:hypothetical protein